MFSLTHVVNVSILLSFIIASRAIHGYWRRRGLPYPPGPSGWPIIGNLLDIPSTSTWLAYTEFSKKYGMVYCLLYQFFFLRPGDMVTGHIVYYRVLGKDIIVLSTIKAIKDLFEKRGEIYSDRPVFPFVDMLVSNLSL